MSSCSDTDLENEKDLTNVDRLGNCEVCGSKKAKYTCPKCEVKTCSLECVRIHKKELECNGTRDRTKFVRIKDFSDTDLLSDYRMLEECSRFVYALKRDEKKKFTRIDNLPVQLLKLKLAARQRGVILQFFSSNFIRHAVNTTRYHNKTNIISWRIEWIFPNVDEKPLKFVDPKCPENKKISVYLDKYLNPDTEPFERSKALAYYRSAGFSGVKILLKAEKVKGSANKFFELDSTESLAENLSGKCIMEFPIIFVVLKDHAYNFEIITPEDEFEYDREQKPKTAVINEETHDKNPNLASFRYHNSRKRQLLTEKIAEQKKLDIEKEIKEEKKRRPKNLLFTTGYSSEESLSECDSENEGS